MNKKNLFFLVIATSLISSCSTMKPLVSKVQPYEVTDLQKFETFSYISLIEGGNRGKLNDSISKQSGELLGESLASFNQIPLKGNILPTDSTIKMQIENEAGFLCAMADRKKNISSIKLTPVLDSLLEARGKRFGLITITSGFTRTKKNYGGQIAKGAAMGLLTLGMYYETPVKSNSTIYCMIVDAKDNNIAFFRKSSLQDKDPLSKKVLTKQIQKLFDGYFWSQSSNTNNTSYDLYE